MQIQANGHGAVDAKVAIGHNIGAGGMLIALCIDVKIGETVSITFQLPGASTERTLRGTVVRLDPNVDDPDGEWPFKAGVEFAEVSPDLIPYLEHAVARFGE